MTTYELQKMLSEMFDYFVNEIVQDDSTAHRVETTLRKDILLKCKYHFVTKKLKND